MLDKGKEWLKKQDWRAITTSPAGLAVIIAVAWSVSHRTGMLSKLSGDASKFQDDDNHESHYSWHIKESILLGCIVA